MTNQSLPNRSDITLSPDEKLLFSQIAAGSEKAFTTIFHLFLPKLHPFILKLTKSEQAAQEVIQETFIRVWLHRYELDTIQNPGGWLYRVASNECYNHMRKMAFNNNHFTNIPVEPDPVNSTHERLDAKELKRLVEEAVNLLPEQRKKIYRMSRDQHKTIPQIAEELQLSPNTVKNALVKSLQFIRQRLENRGDIIFILLYILMGGNKNF